MLGCRRFAVGGLGMEMVLRVWGRVKMVVGLSAGRVRIVVGRVFVCCDGLVVAKKMWVARDCGCILGRLNLLRAVLLD